MWACLSLSLSLSGIASATMFTQEKVTEVSETQLRVAFDGDAVLFSDESERIFKAHGLDKFFEHEKAHENKPLDHVCPQRTTIIEHTNMAVIGTQIKLVFSVSIEKWVSSCTLDGHWDVVWAEMFFSGW